MTHGALCALAILTGGTLWGATALRAGDLNPPAGPVAPTMNSLGELVTSTPINETFTPGDELSQFVIIENGRYHLDEDIRVLDRHAIRIDAPNAIIDLNGHTISGDNDGLTSDYVGVISTGTLALRNGTVTGFRIGVRGGQRLTMEDVVVSKNRLWGVSDAREMILVRCMISDNESTGLGIRAARGAAFVLRDCLFFGNGRVAVSAEVPGVIVNCVVSGNPDEELDYEVSKDVLIIDSIGRSPNDGA